MINKINLKKQQLFWLGPPGLALIPQIATGRVWVTMSGCQKDFIVNAGEFLPTADHEILIEALSDEVIIDIVELPL
ncbi:MAG: hypothetical protein H7256_01580 [Bdellovibrio sp.]|nr:hypothetical protein [Bdellovibrio sp.]